MSTTKIDNLYAMNHGFDDIGFAQPTGAIVEVSRYKTGKWAKYAVVGSNAAHNLTKGQPLNITGTTDYDGPTRVLEVVGPTAFVIKRGFTVTRTGSWDMKQAKGNWDGLIAIGGGASGANMTLEFHNPNQQGGNELATDFLQDVLHVFPGGIKKITLATAGNIRLIRGGTDKPFEAKRSTSVPTVVGYNPTSAAVGDTIDIIGTNFDPIPDRNSVRFHNGVYANVTAATEEILTVVVPAGTDGATAGATGYVAATGVVAVVCNGGQNASGPVYTINL